MISISTLACRVDGGVFDIGVSHLEIIICPRHLVTYLFGIRWRSNRTICTAPSSWCSHPAKKVKGERGITVSQYRKLLHSTGVLIPVASRIVYRK